MVESGGLGSGEDGLGVGFVSGSALARVGSDLVSGEGAAGDAPIAI